MNNTIHAWIEPSGSEGNMTSRGKLDRSEFLIKRFESQTFGAVLGAIIMTGILTWNFRVSLGWKLQQCRIVWNRHWLSLYLVNPCYMILSFSTAWLDWWLPTEILPLADRLKGETWGTRRGSIFIPHFKTSGPGWSRNSDLKKVHFGNGWQLTWQLMS